LPRAWNVQQITEELDVRKLVVKSSYTDFHENTPNSSAADTESEMDGQTQVDSREGVPIFTSSKKLKISEKSNHN
jgi:hypothetical protein